MLSREHRKSLHPSLSGFLFMNILAFHGDFPSFCFPGQTFYLQQQIVESPNLAKTGILDHQFSTIVLRYCTITT